MIRFFLSTLFLFSFSLSFGQVDFKLAPYASVTKLFVGGSVADNSKATDVFIKDGHAVNLGLQFGISKQWGFLVELSSLTLNTSNRTSAYTDLGDELAQKYPINSAYSVSLNYGDPELNFNVLKAGLYHYMEKGRSSLHTMVKVGRLSHIGNSSVGNGSTQINDAEFAYILNSDDYLQLASIKSKKGIMAEVDLRYSYALSKNRKFKAFAEVGLAEGYLQTEFSESVSYPETSSQNASYSYNQGSSFTSIQLGVGLSYQIF